MSSIEKEKVPDILDHIIKEFHETGTTQRHIANMIGVTNDRVCKFLHREGGMWPDDLMAMLHVLGFTLLNRRGEAVIPKAVLEREKAHEKEPEPAAKTIDHTATATTTTPPEA